MCLDTSDGFSLSRSEISRVESGRPSRSVRIRLIASFWYVDRWEDFEGQPDPDSGAPLTTMGDLRGTFASK